MGNLTVRISDDLHALARELAGPGRLNAFVREAIAEKVGRARGRAELEELYARVERLEAAVDRLARRVEGG